MILIKWLSYIQSPFSRAVEQIYTFWHIVDQNVIHDDNLINYFTFNPANEGL